MNAIEKIHATLCESYKQLYADAIEQAKYCLALAKERREQGRPGWSADWLASANFQYQMAISYKQSVKYYSK